MGVEDLLPELIITSDLKDGQFDACLVIGDGGASQEAAQCLTSFTSVDSSCDVKVIPFEGAAGGRIVHCPVSELGDFDDVRVFQEGATKCAEKALRAGAKAPLVVLPDYKGLENAGKAALLGVLHALYTPIEVRDFKQNDTFKKVEKLGIYCVNAKKAAEVKREVFALECGKIVARDIGGSDPERMAAPRVVEYVKKMMDDCIKVEVVNDPSVFEKDYPLLAAVNRCCRNVPRHAGQLIKLEYKGEGTIDQTLLLVGKGITYDTGGADIKAGGVMQGMSRDKCGAAAVAGIFMMLSKYRPKGLKVIGAMAMVRNSVGSECYVSDEIIISRAGVRVRVGNTDAEGRMAMTDPLCEMKEKAVKEINPCIFTIATLTGHVIRCYGENYTSVIDNGPAWRHGISSKISAAGEDSGDPCEITRLRREDFAFNLPRNEYEDVVQANNRASTMTNRGHMSPAAFMITASGLDKHSCNSNSPLRYTHMDIAGSSGSFPDKPTGSPVVALAHAFILNRESGAEQ